MKKIRFDPGGQPLMNNRIMIALLASLSVVSAGSAEEIGISLKSRKMAFLVRLEPGFRGAVLCRKMF